MPYKLVVIDPGLMELGGHHAGFATTLKFLASQTGSNQPTAIKLYANKSIDQRLLKQLELSNGDNVLSMEVEAAFTTNFYQLFEKQNTIADANSFINILAREYYQALLSFYVEFPYQSENPKSADKVVFFYPCLSWEHANALAIALTMLDGNEQVAKIKNENLINAQHVVCAMYNPGINHNGITVSISHRLKFYHGFQRLVRHASTTIYTSDKELASQYQQLLHLQEPFEIHPCYLHDWAHLIPNKSTQGKLNRVPTVLLYNGDAKENKGINLLPTIIDSLLSLNNKTHNQQPIQLTVQYTLSWQYPEIADTLVKLDQLAEKYNNVSLYKHFWSQTELIQHLVNADVVLLPYNAEVYSDKSSGFLWLCAALNKPVVIIGKSWLSREAQRLGLQFKIVPALMKEDVEKGLLKEHFDRVASGIIDVLTDEQSNTANKSKDTMLKQSQSNQTEALNGITQYRAQLFGPIFDWFNGQ
ncbi:glycosyltransferase family protein [Shewanella goraebulensis]|uniref:hypothetical protein n=1 Tax=Shewanella goraebulensis TaxID=3050637 RepID=UPI00254C9378|nr:hypothetical protein [Shewanella goraebulensis]